MKTAAILMTLLCLLANPVWSGQGKEISILIDTDDANREVLEINGEKIVLGEGLGDMDLHKLVKVLSSISDDDAPDQAFIGILLEEDDAQTTGVNVIGITPDSPAQSAGIKAGDIVTGINNSSLVGDPDKTPAQKLFNVLKELKAAEKLELDILRDDQQMSMSIIAARRGDHVKHGLNHMAKELERNLYKQHSNQLSNKLAGIELYPLNRELGSYFDTEHGMLILHVPMDKAIPLQIGDVILKIGERTPSSPSQTWRILNSYDKGENIKITLMRHGKPVTEFLDKP